MVGMAGLDIPARSIRGQIASAIHVVVQAERMEDGMRRIVSVAEISGMEEDVICMQEIFRFRRVGRGGDGRVLGQYEATGVRPRFMEALAARGINLSSDLFALGRVSA
jgi:pilus assembly protein CpaF